MNPRPPPPPFPTRLRSLLFAPGGNAGVLRKLPRAGADGVVLDLEDAVPAAAKEEARRIVGEVAAELVVGHRDLAVFVRVNAVPTPWFADDVAGLPAGVAGVVVPKLESASQVAEVGAALGDAGVADLPIVAGVETAAGVWHVEDLLRPSVRAVYFGAEDFIADIGGVRTPSNSEVLYARSRVALAARLAGALAVDQIVPAFGDDPAFRADAHEGRAIGYRGKLCIHPAQVALAHEVFTPSAEQVARARALLDAYAAAQERGESVLAFDGQMVDEPLARQARAVLDAAD
jgi:citrate lyase subunit beta / citryl-CoA lyase